MFYDTKRTCGGRAHVPRVPLRLLKQQIPSFPFLLLCSVRTHIPTFDVLAPEYDTVNSCQMREDLSTVFFHFLFSSFGGGKLKLALTTLPRFFTSYFSHMSCQLHSIVFAIQR